MLNLGRALVALGWPEVAARLYGAEVARAERELRAMVGVVKSRPRLAGRNIEDGAGRPTGRQAGILPRFPLHQRRAAAGAGMDDDADLSRRLEEDPRAGEVPFEEHWLHWSTLRTWPLHLAVAWTAYPSRAEIVQQGQRPTSFLREAEKRAEVLEALIVGRLTAYGVPDPGDPWGRTVEIPAENWRRLKLRKPGAQAPTLCESAHDMDGGKIKFRSIEIETSCLFDLYPDMNSRHSPTSSVKDRTPLSKRGRPPTKTPIVEEKMRKFIESGRSIEGMTGASLAKEFDASEGTCVPAWRRVLAEKGLVI